MDNGIEDGLSGSVSSGGSRIPVMQNFGLIRRPLDVPGPANSATLKNRKVEMPLYAVHYLENKPHGIGSR